MPLVHRHRLLDVIQASHASSAGAVLCHQNSSDSLADSESEDGMPQVLDKIKTIINVLQAPDASNVATDRSELAARSLLADLEVEANAAMQHASLGTHQSYCWADDVIPVSTTSTVVTLDLSHPCDELEVAAQIEHAKTKRVTPVVQASSEESALQPFRGQVQVTIRACEDGESISALCCVSPHMGDLVLFGDDLTQILRVPLEYLTVTVVHSTSQRSASPCMILHVEVDTNEPVSSFFLAPASHAATDEWALLLSGCNVPVYGMELPSSRASSTAVGRQHTPGTQDNRRRNVLNGTRPLVYWIND